MGKKLYVGNIPFQAREEELKDFFSTVGEVESVKIIIDSRTGQSRGFGFVEMSSEEDARRAIADLNGKAFMKKAIVVNEARPQRQRETRGYGRERRDYGGASGGFKRDRGSGRQKGRR